MHYLDVVYMASKEHEVKCFSKMRDQRHKVTGLTFRCSRSQALPNGCTVHTAEKCRSSVAITKGNCGLKILNPQQEGWVLWGLEVST